MKYNKGLIILLFLALHSCASYQYTSYLEKDNTKLMKQIYQDFDLSSIRSSFGPKITGTKKTLSDFYPSDLVKIDKNEITIEGEYWFYNFKFLERGDFNNDGIEDIKIEMTDKALKGTYFSVSEEILSRPSGESKIEGISSKILYRR